jgi:hypothetical protein
LTANYRHCGNAKRNQINEPAAGRETSKPQRIID